MTEAVQAALSVIKEKEEELNCYVTVDEDGALKRAAKVQELIDNGWETVWESVGGEALDEISTTFGMVNYQSSEDGKRHLYIQDIETDYLDASDEKAEVQFVVIDRLTGCIEDVAAFAASERIESLR